MPLYVTSLLAAFMSLRPTVVRPLGRTFDLEFFGFSEFFDGGFTLGDEDYSLSLGRVMPLIAASMGSRVEKYFPRRADCRGGTNFKLDSGHGRRATSKGRPLTRHSRRGNTLSK